MDEILSALRLEEGSPPLTVAAVYVLLTVAVIGILK